MQKQAMIVSLEFLADFVMNDEVAPRGQFSDPMWPIQSTKATIYPVL
jgi:hypothetical protein